MTAQQWGNIAGLAGTLLLVYLAIKATRLFVLAKRARTAAQKFPADRESWKRRDVGLLFSGILLRGLSDLLPLLKSWGLLS